MNDAGPTRPGSLTVILLPGLDGGVELLGPFIAAAPSGLSVRAQPLPDDRPRDYRELTDWMCERLPPGPVALIAESFSGPLALLVADRCPRVMAIVLCASFAERPLPRLLGHLPAVTWRIPPPLAIVRRVLTGGDEALALAVRNATRRTRPEILAARVNAALSIDVAAELSRNSRPILCLVAQQDRLLSSRCGERIRALNPSVEIVTVPAPHLLLQVAPAEAWTHVAPFLARARESVPAPSDTV